jgi:Flp pilus assembly pilin Flp
MKNWVNVDRLAKDEEGAVLIEYTVSFAILILAVIMGLVAVSRWIGALIVG